MNGNQSSTKGGLYFVFFPFVGDEMFQGIHEGLVADPPEECLLATPIRLIGKVGNAFSAPS